MQRFKNNKSAKCAECADNEGTFEGADAAGNRFMLCEECVNALYTYVDGVFMLWSEKEKLEGRPHYGSEAHADDYHHEEYTLMDDEERRANGYF